MSLNKQRNIIYISSQGAQGIPGRGLIAGGTAGQSLVKASDSNYDVEWATVGNNLVAQAGQIISALKIVYTDPTTGKIFYADKDSSVTASSILGMTLQAGVVDDDISILSGGEWTDSSWSWDMTGNVNLFLGANGAIVQGAPTGAIVLRIGYAISATEIFIRIGELILTA